MKKGAYAAVLAAALISGPVLAEQKLKAGTWEMVMSGSMVNAADAQMARMQKELANMPPAQREMFEKMIQGQLQKMSKPRLQCVDKPAGLKDIARKMLESESGCKSTMKVLSASKGAFTTQCDGMTQKGTITLKGSKSVSVDMVMTPDGEAPQTMTMSGRWLRSGCNGVPQ